MLLVIFIFGLIIGSFLTAFTWRFPRGISINKGRSVCDDCGHKLSWRENIPVFSYLMLGGKCAECGKKISLRYPAIELATGLLFSTIYTLYSGCLFTKASDLPICLWQDKIGILTLPFLFLVTSIFIAIFVIDLEHMLIPDELVFLGLSVALFLLVIFPNDRFYLTLLSGFGAGSFLLLINLATRGRGMGLGDVKLAILGGVLLPYPMTVMWIFLSFILGSVVGIYLLATRKAKLGRQIPFGPFLVAAFFVVLFFGDMGYFSYLGL